MKSNYQRATCPIEINAAGLFFRFISKTGRYAIFIFFIVSALRSSAQEYETELVNKILANSEYAREWSLIRSMRTQGLSDRKIIHYLDSQAIAYKKRREGYYKQNSQGVEFKGGMPPSILASCSPSDIGAENGNFGFWTGETGIKSTVPTNCTSVPFSAAPLPVASRITLVPPPGTDPCADVPGVSIPLPSPLGGKYSIHLGNMDVPTDGPLGGMERIKYALNVQANNVNFVYQYALAVENPAGHTPAEMPYFDFVIVDSLGDTIPCSFQHYIGGPNIPGFRKSNLSNTNCTVHTSSGTSEVWYKPWTTVGVNLTSYIGQTVTIICTTSDCSRCGHFCYAYLDFFCGAVTGAQFCAGTNSVVLTAPYDPAFTYSWSPGGQTTDSITVNPDQVDTVRVKVHPPSGCDFTVTYALHVTDIKAGFTYSVNCGGTASFSDNTTITGGTVSSWDWSFPGGSPPASTLQNPTSTYSTSGTYTVTLRVTSKAGCTSTYSMSVHVPAGLTMTTKGDTICAGSSATLAVGILSGQGPFAYLWSPSSSLNYSTIANPLASPSVTTTYSVSVMNASGCKNNATLTVYVKPSPSAGIKLGQPAFSCDGYRLPVTFIGSSDITSWFWDFGDGSRDASHSPMHTYGYGTYTIQLIASNSHCTISADTTVTISDLSALGNILPANVFTPDGNGKNDCFHPVFTAANGISGASDSLANALSACVSLEIFDRWGVKIFETTDTQKCWDGKTMGGATAKEGTYYYIAKLGNATVKGYLELLR